MMAGPTKDAAPVLLLPRLMLKTLPVGVVEVVQGRVTSISSDTWDLELSGFGSGQKLRYGRLEDPRAREWLETALQGGVEILVHSVRGGGGGLCLWCQKKRTSQEKASWM